jgi:glycosyltransferase involved in cell wall biosynthesis
MKFSIITATWNCEKTIKTCLESLRQQEVDFEHIVVDNLSNDQTLEIIRDFDSPNSRIISEKDSGIYNAFNKGLTLAKGDVIAFLNADDHYLPRALKRVEGAFLKNPSWDLVHGNIEVNKNDLLCSIPPPNGIRSFNGVRILHPATFIKKEVFDRIGNFDESLQIVGDLDLFFRIYNSGIEFHYLNETLTHFLLGGISTSRYKETQQEIQLVCQRYNVSTQAQFFEKAYYWASQLKRILRN